MDKLRRKFAPHYHRIGAIAHEHLHWHLIIIVVWETSKEMGLKAIVELIWAKF